MNTIVRRPNECKNPLINQRDHAWKHATGKHTANITLYLGGAIALIECVGDGNAQRRQNVRFALFDAVQFGRALRGERAREKPNMTLSAQNSNND